MGTLSFMSHPLSVLFCMEDLCFGGTQRQTLELARRLDRTRFSPSMLMLTGPTDLDDIARDAGIPLFYLGHGRSVHPLFFLFLGVMLRSLRPSLIVPCTALPNIWARIWGKILGIPVLGTCRGGGGPKRQHERYLWKLTRHMICNSEALFSVLRDLGIPKGHLTYIPNGVDTDYYMPAPKPPSERSPNVLCVARLCQDKDYPTLFSAFAHVVRACPKATLTVVGDGPEENNIRQWLSEHRLPITLLPASTDIRPYYASARLFALSSVQEGQPNVLLEAMSSGLPICATNVGGIPGMVVHEQTGLLSPVQNPHALAHNILALLGDPLRGDAMGRKGREYVLAKHSFSAMVKAHEALFYAFHKEDS